MNKSIHAVCAIRIFLSVLALTQQSAPAQSPALPEGRVHLDVVVTDKAGKPVSGLGLQDFTLTDDNLPAKILSFHATDATVEQPGHPDEVILLLDAVNEGFETVARSREDIARFLRENGGHLKQPVSVFVLSDEGAKVLLQPSMDGNALAAKLVQTDAGLRPIGRSAGGNGAIERFELSIKWMDVIARDEVKRPGRKLLIWAGAGWPLLDRPGLETSLKSQQEMFAEIIDLSKTLREARMTVYSVSLGDAHLGTYLYESYLKGVKTAQRTNPGNLALKVLATQSGGRVISPDNDLAGQIETCAQDASAFYSISFDPPRADKPNEYHDLKVEIDKPGLTARTSTGYYNQP